MAGFNDIQRMGAQSIQSVISGNNGNTQTQTQQQPQGQTATPLGMDAAVLTGGGPSYMQAIEALMFSQIALNMNSGAQSLGNLQALSNGGQARSTAKDSDGKSLATNYGTGNNFGVFSPNFYSPGGVGGRSGGNGGYSGGGYGSGGRTGGGNVATTGIDRMIELLLAQSLGQNGAAGNSQPRLHQDAVTLVGRSPDSQSNAFHELTGALVGLLAEQINNRGENTPPPSPQMLRLLSQLTEQQHDQAPSETLSTPKLHALMDELSVMQLIQGTRSNSSPSAANPMVNTIMDLMQNLLGAQGGGSVSSSQMQNLLGALMNNLKQEPGGDSSPAAAMMQQMLPEMMAMLSAETAHVPGAVTQQQGSSSSAAGSSARQTNPVRLPSFSANISSDGSSSGSVQGSSGAAKFQVQPGEGGGVMILDGSQNKDIAGGFGIGASVSQNDQGKEQIQAGTFSWNGGNDAIALNGKGDAAVTSDGGRTWAPLPTQGVSTYNPGNGGPTLTFNPSDKSVKFSASNNSNDNISAEMRASDNGVSFTNIESTGVTAGGQLASALT